MKKIFQKTYDGESLCDLERDIIESVDPRYNKKAVEIPTDESGIQKGRFIVTIEWELDA